MLHYYAGGLIIISLIFRAVYNISIKNKKNIIKELYTECSESWGQFVELDE